MLNKDDFDDILGEGAYDALYAPDPTTVKIIFDGDKLTIERGGDLIEGTVDNELMLNLASMLSFHATERFAEALDDENGDYHVEVLKIDFNTISRQSDEKWC